MCLGIACAGSALGLAAAGRWKEMLAAPSPAASSDGSSTDKTLYGEAGSGIVDDVTIGAAAAQAAQSKREEEVAVRTPDRLEYSLCPWSVWARAGW